MKIFQIGAGGFNASGMAIVAAEDAEFATQLANRESRNRVAVRDNVDFDLTYHAMNAKVISGAVAMSTPANRFDQRACEAAVLSMHEFGFPHLPSTGSGIKVTF